MGIARVQVPTPRMHGLKPGAPSLSKDPPMAGAVAMLSPVGLIGPAREISPDPANLNMHGKDTKMQTMLSLRWRALVVVATLVAMVVAAAPARSIVRAQDPTLTVFAIGFVDVAGGTDPNCPGCDGEFGADDEAFAVDNPLPELEFVIKDQGGAEIASGTTEALANLQRAQMEVPELLDDEEYTLELVAVPDGWQLCPNESTLSLIHI